MELLRELERLRGVILESSFKKKSGDFGDPRICLRQRARRRSSNGRGSSQGTWYTTEIT